MRLLTGLTSTIPGALGAGIVVSDETGSRQVAGVGVARELDEAQISSGSGPLIEAARFEEVQITTPFSLMGYPDLVRTLPDLQSELPVAVVVIPSAWVEESRMATSLYLKAAPTTHDLDVLGWYEPMLGYALGLLDYCGEAENRAEQIVAMVGARAIIEQAKGILMSQRAVDADEAFAVLVHASQRTNVKVRQLAAALVESVDRDRSAPRPERWLRPPVPVEARDAAKQLWGELTAR